MGSVNKHQPVCCCGAAPPPCPGGNIVLTVSVTYCAGNLPGVLIELVSGSTTVASCSTNASGACTLNPPAAATYTLRASRAGYATQTRSVTFNCFFLNYSQSFVMVAAVGSVSLANCVEPFAGDPTAFRFTLTDHLGTVTLNYIAQSGAAPNVTYTWGACRLFTTRWGRPADCSGADIAVTSAAYYELAMSCTSTGLTLFYPACSLGNFWCSYRVIAASCQASKPSGVSYLPIVGVIATKGCAPAFALTGRWGEDSVNDGFGNTLAYGCNLGQLYDKPGGNPYYIPGADDIPSGYTDFTLSQL